MKLSARDKAEANQPYRNSYKYLKGNKNEVNKF